MDDAEALREARARALGYSSTSFYRGEASGRLPDTYEGGGFFSRNPETARGFAERGGKAEPREFRLDLSRMFGHGTPVKAHQFEAILDAAAKHDPQLAANMMHLIELPPGKGPEWFRQWLKVQPNVELMAHADLRPLIMNSAAPERILKDAGYDSLYNGPDVRKLTGSGIRLNDAEFNPKRRSSINIKAGWLLPLTAGGLAYDAARSEAEAAGADRTEARTRGLTAGGVAAGTTAGAAYGMNRLARVISPVARGAMMIGGEVMAPFAAADAYDPTEEQLARDRNIAARRFPSWARLGAIEDAYQMSQVPERNPGRNPAVPR